MVFKNFTLLFHETELVTLKICSCVWLENVLNLALKRKVYKHAAFENRSRY